MWHEMQAKLKNTETKNWQRKAKTGVLAFLLQIKCCVKPVSSFYFECRKSISSVINISVIIMH